MKLKNKLFLKGLFHSFLQFIIVIVYGLFNDCLLEILISYGCFFCFRPSFEKQYHALTSWGCTFIHTIVFYLVSLWLPHKSISIMLAIVLTFVINYLSFIYRDYLDVKKPKKKKRNTNRQILIDILGKENLDEESIEKYCVAKGMPNLTETIYLYLNNKLDDTAEILGVDNSTIIRRINNFISESKLD